MNNAMPALPTSAEAFTRLVRERLHLRPPAPFAFNANGDLRRVSAVLFLFGADSDGNPFLILNKRSQRVRQSGDLCCPGGGVSPIIDALLAKWLRLPATPLSRWRQGVWWKRHRPTDWPKLNLLLATALREGFEEMRLNPFGVTFLGPLPAQQLVMFERTIFPLVGWVNRQRHFFPNWEVDKIVRIPVTALFDHNNYARYRISFRSDTPRMPDMPCFVHRHNSHDELLWGATYRITEQFLKTIFGYKPPILDSLPVIHRRLDRHYLEGGASDRSA